MSIFLSWAEETLRTEWEVAVQGWGEPLSAQGWIAGQESWSCSAQEAEV